MVTPAASKDGGKPADIKGEKISKLAEDKMKLTEAKKGTTTATGTSLQKQAIIKAGATDKKEADKLKQEPVQKDDA